jgi:hypothetical protein
MSENKMAGNKFFTGAADGERALAWEHRINNYLLLAQFYKDEGLMQDAAHHYANLALEMMEAPEQDKFVVSKHFRSFDKLASL